MSDSKWNRGMSKGQNRLSQISDAIIPVTKDFIKPVLATFVCGLFPLIRPVANFMGKYSFLPITILYLFFLPKPTIGAQIQSTIFGLSGMLLGLAWSLFGRSVGAMLNRNGHSGTVFMAVLLILAGFFAALVKSTVPRLTSTSMIFLFMGIWGLTNETDTTSVTSRDFLDLFWATLFTALSTLLICCTILPKTAADVFECSILDTINLSRQLLEVLTDNFFNSTDLKAEPLKGSISKSIKLMNTSYLDASNEIGLLRTQVQFLKPLLEHLQMINFSLRTDTDAEQTIHKETLQVQNLERLDTFDYGATRYFLHRGGGLPHQKQDRHISRNKPENKQVRKHFQTYFLKIRIDIDAGFKIVHDVVSACANLANPPPACHHILTYRDSLTFSLDLFKLDCKNQLHHFTSANSLLEDESFEISSFMVSFLQLADELDSMLEDCLEICQIIPSHGKRIRWPDIVQAHWWSDAGEKWGGAHPHALEQLNARTEHEAVDKRRVSLRVRLSRFLYARHSHHAKFATKMALGLGLLGLIAWLPSSKAWYQEHRGTWMLISFFYTLESSTGATVRVCALRMLGTIVGTVYAFCVVMICQNHPEAIALLVFIAGIPMSYLILKTTIPGVGVVWAISIPPVLFLPYLGVVQNTPKEVFLLALTRAYQIGLGILATLILNLTFWPYHARSRLTTSLSQTLEVLTKYYLSISRQNLQQPHLPVHSTTNQFKQLEESCQNHMSHSATLLGIVGLELRLLPLPLETYKHLIPRLSSILDYFVTIRRIRQYLKNDIREEVVTQVIEQRKQLVSSILLNLFAVSKALETRSPLPQFLTSPLDAQENLLIHVRHDYLRLDFQYFYFLAEAEALRRVCVDIEDVIDLIKEIVGEDAFISSSTPKILDPVCEDARIDYKAEVQRAHSF